MTQCRIVALDGHDGAGKTTLACALADKLDGVHCRPFHGSLGTALLRAAERGDFDQVISIGERGIITALETTGTTRRVVLDRSWMTVASLIEAERLSEFFARWTKWIPTVLCWADLPTTLKRLNQRTQPSGSVSAHRYYLDAYQSLAERGQNPVVRTDIYSEQECLERLLQWIRGTEV